MTNVTCIKCNKEGSLTIKQTKSKGITYKYWYVEHHLKGDKIKWCYLGKFEKLPEEYKLLIHKDTQADTQKNRETNNLKFSSIEQNNQNKNSAPIAQRLEQRFRKP